MFSLSERPHPVESLQQVWIARGGARPAAAGVHHNWDTTNKQLGERGKSWLLTAESEVDVRQDRLRRSAQCARAPFGRQHRSPLPGSGEECELTI